jgi:hypothetical protein
VLKKKASNFIIAGGRAFYRTIRRSRADLFAQGGFAAIALDRQQGNDLIRSALESGKPKMISRLGFVEANAVLNHLEIEACKDYSRLIKLDAALRGMRSRWDVNLLSMLHWNAGVFPNDPETASKFSKLYLKCFSEMDILGAFGEVPGEYFLWRKYCPSATVIHVQSLEPYRHESPWSAALQGKKVLVVHPFEKSISQQYLKRIELFPGRDVLPEFHLEVIQAVQSICGSPVGFKTWFDALNAMKKEMASRDFDICIIGAGAYGLPLCNFAKEMGKIGIHMGGATQILFGIKGLRWEKFIPEVAVLYNDAWIRPDECERPHDSHKIEGGCYW